MGSFLVISAYFEYTESLKDLLEDVGSVALLAETT